MKKICIVQSLVGGGGGNDVVLKHLLNTLKENDVTVYTNSKPLMPLDVKVETRIPIKLPFFGLYQQILGFKTPQSFSKYDIIIILSGNMVINTVGKKMYHYNQNNFGDISDNTTSKYRSGFWSLYYFPFKQFLKSLNKKIQQSNIEFIANSYYIAGKMNDKYNKKCKVIYPPVDLKELQNKPKKKQVITIARISKEKNLEEAIEIMNPLRTEYIIMGTVKAANYEYFTLLRQKAKQRALFDVNVTRDEIIQQLAESKVYLQSSVETFGISVVEAIASGCIPIVPNNSGNIETVPFDELRYNSVAEGTVKVSNALEGKYDYYLPKLQEHIQQFDISRFKHEITKLIENE